jgi:hypothetical protein
LKKLFLVLLSFFILTGSQAQITGLEILGKRKKITVPFKYKQGFILIDINFASVLPLTFLFDTGAEHTLLFKKELSDILGIPYSRRVRVLGADLTKELYAQIARNVSLEIPNGIPVNRDILVLEENVYKLDQVSGVQIDGILGCSYFKDLVVEIDYRRQLITLIKPDNFKPPKKNFITFDLEISRSKPYIKTEVELLDSSVHNVKLLIDTGAAIPFLLHTNTSPSLRMPDRVISGNLGLGLGGVIQGYLGKVRSLKMKRLAFNNLLTSFQDLDLELFGDSSIVRNGLLGNKILDRFKVTLDLYRSKGYFSPIKKSFAKDFEYDKSGLVIIAVGHNLNEYFVKDVIKNSPAEEAGIHRGDQIKCIGIFSSKWFTLERILKKLRGKTGKGIKLTIIREGQKLKRTIVLRDLFEIGK